MSEEEYYRWYEKTYSEITGLNKLKIPGFQEIVQNFEYRYSSIWRQNTLELMRYFVIPLKTDFICTSFKITRKGSSSLYRNVNVQYNSIYAIMYSSYNDNNFNFEFAVSGSTYKSMDGEYRHGFIKVNILLEFLKKEKSFIDMEEYMIDQLKNNYIAFESETLIPDHLTNINLKVFNRKLEKERIALYLYLAAWIKAINLLNEWGKLENHINNGFKESIFMLDDEDYIKDWVKKYSKKELTDLRNECERLFISTKQNTSLTRIGQKFIQLSIKEIKEIGNILYSSWREIYISQQVGNLVINGISPSFSIFNDWFLIMKNSDSFWSNRTSLFKIDYSKISETILQKLEEARHYTYTFDPIEKKNLFLSLTMQGLSGAIEVPMDYIEEKLILSDVILCFLMEHVGHTWADIPSMISSEQFQYSIGPLFQNYDLFMKFIFEFLIALFCLNIKLDIIHSDIHLNNITIFKLTKLSQEINNPVILYTFNNKHYLFHHFNTFLCLIDFSRAFIGYDKLKRDFKENYENIWNNQKIRMMQTIRQNIPDFYHANTNKIQLAIIEDFNNVFKICTALDAYKVSSGLLRLFKNEILSIKNNKNINYSLVSEKYLPILEKIRSMAYNYMTSNFIQLFNKKFDKDKLENINAIIIKELFSSFIIESYNGSSDIILTDYYCVDNELKYDGNVFENFPPTLRYDYVEKQHIKYPEIDRKHYLSYLKFLKKKEPEKKIDKVKKDINEKYKREGPKEGEILNIDQNDSIPSPLIN